MDAVNSKRNCNVYKYNERHSTLFYYIWRQLLNWPQFLLPIMRMLSNAFGNFDLRGMQNGNNNKIWTDTYILWDNISFHHNLWHCKKQKREKARKEKAKKGKIWLVYTVHTKAYGRNKLFVSFLCKMFL